MYTKNAVGRCRRMLAAWALAGLVTGPAAGHACDLCAIYTTTALQQDQTGLRLGISEQFTHFGTLMDGDHTVGNPEDEYLDSSITQLVVGYNFLSSVGAQLNLPIIARSFRRVEGDGVEDGDENGIGDLSLIGTIAPFSRVYDEGVVRLALFGGVKFPTGDSDRLDEEIGHEHSGGHEMDHEMPMSGIHGHDLALGSGSYDGIVGGQLFGTWRRAFVSANVQYLVCSTGSFEYRYANSLLWNTGPGVYALLGDNLWGAPYSVGGQVLFSGETKGKDTIDGAPVGDTGITSLFLGPALSVGWGTRLYVDLAADVPVREHTTSLMIVPDYRLRGGVTWYF